MASLFSDFLKALGVPHTVDYSDRQFAGMPFQSLFGLSKLLEQYGVDNEALRLADKSELAQIQPPFLADTDDGFVIVDGRQGGNVLYTTQGQSESMPQAAFEQACNGVVLLAYPTSASVEPGYAKHRLYEAIGYAKTWALVLVAAALVAYLFVTNGLYRHWSTIGLTIFNCTGLVFASMLMQKTLKLKTKAADAVCGVLEEGGCDSILELKASSFFGIFKWSEVGFSYFSVSLMCLLVFPQFVGYLALINACCLPFTVWSIWYQKFRAKVWCTLCVSVQTTLWLLFFCNLFGGWLRHAFPLRIEFWVLVGAYVVVLLALNRFDAAVLKTESHGQDDSQAQS